MLVGVLRLRQEGGNSFSFGPFGKILWQQVRSSQFPLSVMLPK